MYVEVGALGPDDAVVDLLMGDQEQQWIMATGNQNRTRLSFGEKFFTDGSSLLAW